jgi:hypothetical protein
VRGRWTGKREWLAAEVNRTSALVGRAVIGTMRRAPKARSALGCEFVRETWARMRFAWRRNGMRAWAAKDARLVVKLRA